MRPYYYDITNFYGQKGEVHSDCGDIVFKNNGGVVTINEGLQLGLGQSLTIAANEWENNKTIFRYKETFPLSGLPVNFSVIRKKYTDNINDTNLINTIGQPKRKFYNDIALHTDVASSFESDCGTITIFNSNNTAPVVLNGSILLSFNDSIVIRANENENNKTVFTYRQWDPLLPFPVGLSVIRKKYI